MASGGWLGVVCTLMAAELGDCSFTVGDVPGPEFSERLVEITGSGTEVEYDSAELIKLEIALLALPGAVEIVGEDSDTEPID